MEKTLEMVDDVTELLQAYLEKRDSERVSARLKIRFKEIERLEADNILSAGDFTDVFFSNHLEGPVGEGLADALTENISVSGLKLIGDMRLVGGQALKEGAYLLVEIQVPDAPMPVRTLATVVWAESDEAEADLFHAGLFFVAINKQDVMKVARFLVLQRRAKHA